MIKHIGTMLCVWLCAVAVAEFDVELFGHVCVWASPVDVGIECVWSATL